MEISFDEKLTKTYVLFLQSQSRRLVTNHYPKDCLVVTLNYSYHAKSVHTNLAKAINDFDAKTSGSEDS